MASQTDRIKTERDRLELDRLRNQRRVERLRTVAIKSRAAIVRELSGKRSGGRGHIGVAGARAGAMASSSGTSGYQNAGRTRLRDGARPRGGSAMSHLRAWEQHELRKDSQALDRGSRLFRGLVSRHADMVVGSGFLMKPRTRDEAWNKAAARFWERWAESIGVDGVEGVDITGRHTLSQLLHEMVRGGCCVDGDVGAIKTPRGQVQCIESERIRNPQNQPDRTGLMGGVETDDVGKPIAYHISEWAENGQAYPEVVTRPIPARDFFLLANPNRMRTGQYRGEPMGASLVEAFEHLDQTSQSVRINFYVGACQALFVSSNSPGEDQAFASTATDSDELGARYLEDIEPGTINHIGNDKTVTGFNPTQPNTPYVTLFETEVMQVAADCGMPVVMFLLDFSKVNMSSARAALTVAFRGFRRWQEYLIQCFLEPLYRWRIAMAIRRGEIDGFEAGYVPEDWERCDFVAPPAPVLDVLVEMQAAELGVRSGLKTRQQTLHELNGTEFDDVTSQQEIEKDAHEKAGLSFSDAGPNGGAMKETTATERADGTEVAGGQKQAA